MGGDGSIKSDYQNQRLDFILPGPKNRISALIQK